MIIHNIRFRRKKKIRKIFSRHSSYLELGESCHSFYAYYMENGKKLQFLSRLRHNDYIQMVSRNNTRIQNRFLVLCVHSGIVEHV